MQDNVDYVLGILMPRAKQIILNLKVLYPEK